MMDMLFCLREEKGNAKGMTRGSMANSITVLACYPIRVNLRILQRQLSPVKS